MEGYSLQNCNYGPYNTYDTRSHDIMEQMGNIAEVPWLPLITMKEELISHMKESIVIEEPVNDDLNELSASIIQFMKDLQFQRSKMNEAEKKMKQVIQDTQKDIEVITTFIEFLSKVSRQTDKDMEPLQSQIKTISADIENNSKMEPETIRIIDRNKRGNLWKKLSPVINHPEDEPKKCERETPVLIRWD